jgi:hypothetical protein
MWTTLALAVALTAFRAQGDQLSLTNIRSLYGPFGAERKENKFLPGDFVWVEFDIEGLKITKGRAHYSMALEVTDSQGKLLYGRNPTEQQAPTQLGGNRLPALTQLEIGGSFAPGVYSMKVTVKDLESKAEKSLVQKVEVLPKDFGLGRIIISVDPDIHFPLPPSGPVGMILYFSFYALGFDRDQATGQPNVLVEMVVTDENGKKTLPEPLIGEMKEGVAKAATVSPLLQFMLPLNRPGKFTVELRGTDRVSKKTAKISIPLVVTEPRAAVEK